MKSRNAFTLIEVVLAIGVFAFAMVTIFTLVSRGMKTNREARIEGASAILSGQINSLLKAPYAWTTNASNNPALTNFLNSKTLTDVASGQTIIKTNYYTQDLQLTNSAQSADFQVVTELSPISTSFVQAADSSLQNAITRMSAQANCVILNLEISHPAQAPESLRTKRNIFSILSRTTDE